MIKNEVIIRYKTGCFERTYNWDLSQIDKSLAKDGNGLVVQKVERISVLPQIIVDSYNDIDFNHLYFEAWNVKNNAVVYEKDYKEKYDDSWAYLPITWDHRLRDCAEKYQTKGSVTMNGVVFWVAESDPLFRTLRECLKEGGVKFAVDLLSAETLNCEHELTKVFAHQFSHSWDLQQDESLIEAVYEIFSSSQVQLKLDRILEDIDEHFFRLPIFSELRSYVVKTFREGR